MAADSGTRTLVRPRRRIASLDALRGLTLVSMIAYHACWDLVYLFHADWDWYRGTGAYIWQQSICWTFILLSGFCFSLGRRPLRRGLTVFGCGWVVTLVTVLLRHEEHLAVRRQVNKVLVHRDAERAEGVVQPGVHVGECRFVGDFIS